MPRTLICSLILLLSACQAPDEPAASETPTPPPVELALAPGSVDFGIAAVGTRLTLSVTIENPGAESVVVPSPSLTGSGFLVEQMPAVLGPGERTELVVGFEPNAPGVIEGRLWFPSALGRPEVLLRGEGLLPQLQVPTEAVDFGAPPEGCVGDTAFYVTNVSGVPVEIVSIEVAGGDGQVELVSDLPPALGPGESALIQLTYRPDGPDSVTGLILITTADPTSTTSVVPFADGPDGDITSTIEVDVPPASLDLLLVIDDSSCSTAEQNRLAAALPSYLDSELLGVDWRVAVTTTSPGQGGDYVGDTPWVHSLQEGWSAELAARIQQGTSGSGDERGLDAAVQALSAPQSTDFLRANTPLAAIVVSDERDHSVIFPETSDYIDVFASLRPDPAQVVFHDITGGATGCTESIGSTGPGLGYIDVTTALGGVSGSICAPDYDAIVADQMAVSLNPPRFVPLPESTVPDSVTVELEGPIAWEPLAFERVDGGVRLDAPAPWDALVRVRYRDTNLCVQF